MVRFGLAGTASDSKTFRMAYIVRFSFVLMGKKRRLYGAVRTFGITADRDGCTNFGNMKSVSPG